MCGIAGQYNFGHDAPVDLDTIRRMIATIAHRGPDDEGTYLSGSLGLGFRRLSIIDLSTGHQPMCDIQRTVWVVFNGEIYNFKELRQELESHGHIFRTSCDTEVIVHGFKQWGDAVLNRLNGMFGLAIWDEKRRRLLVARDPMGIKPVYYRLRDGALWFGSEIRPILAALPERPAVDLVGLNLFLRYRYTPAPYTIHQGIKKLAPGQAIVVENGQANVARYYRYQPKLLSPPPEPEEAKERLLQLYRAAIGRHLVSDVPLGLLLSGGVDSGLLLGLMSLFGAHWPTFTVGYGNSFRDDELEDAAETARIYSSRHTEVRLDRRRFEEALPKIVQILEEPVASSSIVPMYFVSERARTDVKVALIGQGPDELFGGYRRHLGVRYGSSWRLLPSFTRSTVATVVNALPRNETLKRGIGALNVADRMHRYQEVFSLLPGPVVDGLFHPGLLAAHVGDTVLQCWSDYEEQMQELDELGGLQLLELRSSLPDELLMYADKMSMIHGLELRVPFLDREVVEYVQTLGPRFKIHLNQQKWLHREVCRDFLPPAILARKKRGFAVNVVDSWFQASVRGRHQDYLQDDASLIYGYFQRDEIRRLMAEHAAARHDHHKVLFSLVVFEEWLRSSHDRRVLSTSSE